MISSKNGCVFRHDLTNHTLQITFDAWWASMNVDSKHPIACNIFRHAPSWCLYLDCGFEETGSPHVIGIIYDHFVCHPTEHGTSSMGKHLLSLAQIAKLNELTEWEVMKLTCSMVNESVLEFMKSHGSWGITKERSWRKFIFNIQIRSIWTELTD